jgi:hypothetical protein
MNLQPLYYHDEMISLCAVLSCNILFGGTVPEHDLANLRFTSLNCFCKTWFVYFSPYDLASCSHISFCLWRNQLQHTYNCVIVRMYQKAILASRGCSKQKLDAPGCPLG